MSNTDKEDRPKLEIRDVLFGDLPLSEWPGETATAEVEPWLSFAKARDHLRLGETQDAVTLFRKVLAMPDLESRHYLQAWHFLREAGIQPDPSDAKQVLGVVVEVALPEGLDIVVAYADGSARYFNHSGAAVIWDAPDTSLAEEIDHLLHTGKTVVDQIDPWEGSRPPAPPTGQARISMLAPGGLYFGQGRYENLVSDRLGGAVISAALRLMQSLMAKTEENS
jgi:hypothetical protein